MGSDRLREYEQMDMARDDPPSSGREMKQGSGQSGQWQGYVVPYRYVGPGYRGWGYYSVLYQGPAGSEGEGSRNAWSGSRQSTYGASRYGESPYGESESGRYSGSQPAGAPFGAGQWRGEQWASEDRGQFYGYGPKGYRRSDDRVKDEVSDNLMRAGQLDASDIEVMVSDGIVKLAGWVPDKWSKRAAEDIAESTMGVGDVDNQLQVAALSQGTGRGRTTSSDTARPTTQSTGRTGTTSKRSSGSGSSSRPSGTTGSTGTSGSTAGSTSSGSRANRSSTTTRNGSRETATTR
jgi:osmotically-inducible protein OsmY